MKPDPNEFARKVLWQLCGLRSELRHHRIMQARQMGLESGDSEEDIMKAWDRQTEKLARELYLDAAQAAGIPPATPDQQPEPGDQGGESRF